MGELKEPKVALLLDPKALAVLLLAPKTLAEVLPLDPKALPVLALANDELAPKPLLPNEFPGFVVPNALVLFPKVGACDEAWANGELPFVAALKPGAFANELKPPELEILGLLENAGVPNAGLKVELEPNPD